MIELLREKQDDKQVENHRPKPVVETIGGTLVVASLGDSLSCAGPPGSGVGSVRGAFPAGPALTAHRAVDPRAEIPPSGRSPLPAVKLSQGASPATLLTVQQGCRLP